MKLRRLSHTLSLTKLEVHFRDVNFIFSSLAYMPYLTMLESPDKGFVTAVLASNGVQATDVVTFNLQPDQQTYYDRCSYVTVGASVVSAVCAESRVDLHSTAPVQNHFIFVSLLTVNGPAP